MTVVTLSTIIGDIPSSWKLRKLSEIASEEKRAIISGPFGSNISSKFFTPSGVPVIRGSSLSTKIGEKFIDEGFVFVSELKAAELNAWANVGDIIFTAAGTIGQVGLIEESLSFSAYVISNKQLRVTLNTSLVDELFVYYWFASPYMSRWIKSCDTGSTIPLINLTVLKSLPFPCPPLSEQKAIAEVLSSLDDKIDLLHRQNKTLEALAEALFRQWFIEEANDDWEERPLKELCIIKNGHAFKSPEYTEGGQKIIRTLNFENHTVKLDKLVYLSPENAKNYERFYLERNDFLLVMVGASIGNFAIVTDHILPALQNQNMWRFQALNKKLQHYLNFALRHLVAENLRIASGSARQFFQKSAFYELKILNPPPEFLERFNQLSENTFSKIESNLQQIETLEKLRDTLLPKLMSGEVRVDYDREAA